MKALGLVCLCAVLFWTSNVYAGGCSNGQCGVSVLAPGVSVQVQPQVFVPPIVVPQFQLQAQAQLVPQFQLQASAPLVVPQLGFPVIDFNDNNQRVLIRRRNGTVQADVQGNIRSIRRGLFGRVKRIEFFD